MILFLVDVQNLFWSVRDTFGPDARVDFKQLLDVARDGREAHMRSIAYYVRAPHATTSFPNALGTLGYEVRTTHLRKDGEGRMTNTDVDSRLICDALEAVFTNPEIDTVIVASGDGDFIPMYEVFVRKGLKVEVMAFQDALNPELLKKAQVRLLTRSVLWEGVQHAGADEGGIAEGGS